MFSTILFWDLSDLYLMLSTILFWYLAYLYLMFILGLYQISTWRCLPYYSIRQLQYYSGIVSDLHLMLSTILFWDCNRSLPDVVYNTILWLSFNFNSSLSRLLEGKPNTRIVYGVPKMKKIRDFDILINIILVAHNEEKRIRVKTLLSKPWTDQGWQTYPNWKLL